MSLMTHLWQSTLCVGVAALLAYALRRASARTRYSIWLFASLKFLIPLPLLFAAGTYVGSLLSALMDPRWSVAFRWLDQPLIRWSVTSGGVEPASIAAFDRPWVLALATVWLTGTLVLGTRRWWQWQRVSRLARAATPLDSAEREAAALRRLMSAAGRARVPLLRCAAQLEPGVLGVFRPSILWPAGLSERLQDDELDAILSHELHHIERQDNLSALVQMVVETLFWFHPAVWWIGARLLSERERACDEAVIERGAPQQTYAESILKVCGFCLRSPLASVAGVGGANLSDRIERIMRRPAPLSASWPVRLLLAAIVAAAAAMPLAAGVLSEQQKDTTSETKPYRLGPGITAPVLVKEVHPNYTPEAMKAKIQGSVMLEAVVLATGAVGDVTVTKSLDTVYGLDDQAIKAIKQWKFKPGTKDTKAVPVAVEVEMSFKLK
jgi:bla regulator protein blaR1